MQKVWTVAACWIGSIAPWVGGVSAQTYPTKPVRIFTSSAGGGQDFVARVIEQELKSGLGAPLVIENRSGGGVVSGQIVAKAAADGYSLLLASNNLWLTPFMRDDVPYDPVNDFSPITLATSAPNILVAHPSLPVKSVRELVALAKARPGELNYSSGPTGSSPHLSAELFKYLAGVKLVGVNYSTTSARMASLIGGEVQMEFSPVGAVTPHIKSGKLRALAVTSAEPTTLVPGIPTLAAGGVPNYESVMVTGLLAPAKTPQVVIGRLNQAVVRVLNLPDSKQKFASSGVESIGTTAEAFATAIRAEMARMGKVIKDAGIRGE